MQQINFPEDQEKNAAIFLYFSLLKKRKKQF